MSEAARGCPIFAHKWIASLARSSTFDFRRGSSISLSIHDKILDFPSEASKDRRLALEIERILVYGLSCEHTEQVETFIGILEWISPNKLPLICIFDTAIYC
jgi:hypothetical protein